MSSLRLRLVPLLLFFALATSATAQDAADSAPLAGVFPQGFDQTLYKGVVGSVLDAIPMDPEKRLDLQRTNAVVGNTLLGRSLTVLAGLSNPVLLVGGFVWGLWAASNIKPAETGAKSIADSRRSGGGVAPEPMVALLDRSSGADDAPANSRREPVLVSSIYSVYSDTAADSSYHVIKVWLPQRPPVLSR